MTITTEPAEPQRISAFSECWVGGRQLTREEDDEVAAIKALGVCALCRRSGQRLVFEHDHSVGIHGGRGMTCQMCNTGHMAGVDAGRYAIDPPTRHYLMNPWHLTRLGQRLPYDPLVHVSVADLDNHDRHELDRISADGGDGAWAVRTLRPSFGHPALRSVLSRNDIRAVLRLRMLNRLGLNKQDIAEIGPQTSSFQRFHLARVLANHSSDWAVDARSVFRLDRKETD